MANNSVLDAYAAAQGEIRGSIAQIKEYEGYFDVAYKVPGGACDMGTMILKSMITPEYVAVLQSLGNAKDSPIRIIKQHANPHHNGIIIIGDRVVANFEGLKL